MSIMSAIKATALLAAVLAVGMVFILFVTAIKVAATIVLLGLMLAGLWYVFYRGFKGD